MQLPERYFLPTAANFPDDQQPLFIDQTDFTIIIIMTDNVCEEQRKADEETITCAEELPHLDLQEYIHGTTGHHVNS